MDLLFLRFDDSVSQAQLDDNELVVRWGLDGHFYVYKNAHGHQYVKINGDKFLDFLENWCILRA